MSARSTRASSAVERLKRRTGQSDWSMTITGAGLFQLSEHPDAAPLHAPLELDEFVAYVDKLGPQAEKRVSKHDRAFERQLRKTQD
ncbi:hypothetical protein [Massilia sp. TS11]|uniref:hypothetical protein n=1 Tax=Massilia sp. TS11 TaxID=2908003 RepID=UPI001EDC8591|nr:hypothetical protein [Massilia sp. TS11]MCG2585283.1 hypothetical protein [Massilia sp. TS11]